VVDNSRIAKSRAALAFNILAYCKPHIVFDWKSDIAPAPSTRAPYANQLPVYVKVLGAERSAIVYMTPGQIEWTAL
jgi:hypothetical protein